jgi:hypothetical protein
VAVRPVGSYRVGASTDGASYVGLEAARCNKRGVEFLSVTSLRTRYTRYGRCGLAPAPLAARTAGLNYRAQEGLAGACQS